MLRHDNLSPKSDVSTASGLPMTGQSVGRFNRVAVLGAGAWGTALAATATYSGAEIVLWGRDGTVAADISKNNRNDRYLPGIELPAALSSTTDLKAAVQGAEAVLVVVPSRAVRGTTAALADLIAPEIPVALAAKGIEAETGLLMSQVAEETLGNRPIGAISGPTFARECALGHPTAAVVAFPFSAAERGDPSSGPAARFALTLSGGAFRAYLSDDIVGVEIGGAAKNVIAIACGMMAGAGFAENTRAALITRGLEEMKALAIALGGKPETLGGLSGVGDLMLTCSSKTSRNMSLGFELGSGTPRKMCFGGEPILVEGEVNARSVVDLARQQGVAMPISETVFSILHEGAEIGAAFSRLWDRPIKSEIRGLNIEIENPAAESSAEALRSKRF